MDDTHRRFAEQIPWYLRNDLSRQERSALESHLHECAGCRELLETARDLAAGVPEAAAPLEEHPEAHLLADVALEPKSVATEARARVEEHLSTCPPCREAAEILRRQGGKPGERRHRRGHRGPERPRRNPLSRTLLHPVAAAFYLAALLALLPLSLRSGPGTEREREAPEVAWVVPPAARLFPDDRMRGESGESEPNVRPIDARGKLLRLDLMTDLDLVGWEDVDEQRPIVLRVLAPEGTAVVERRLRVSDVGEGGLVSLVVPRDLLQAGETYRVELRRGRPDADAERLFSSEIVLRRASE
jgi:hypothetical protein